MIVLVLNAGSSSLKFQVIDADIERAPHIRDVKLARGAMDRIGGDAIFSVVAVNDISHREAMSVGDHEEATRKVLEWLDSGHRAIPGLKTLSNLEAVGHRVVHGGDRFAKSVLINDEVLAAIEELNELAPLHNPACARGIRAARAALGPVVPMVAVFDTTFHQTLPDYASVYAIPHELSVRHRIRRYGFHGIAHHYMTLRYAQITARPCDQVNIITLHLGNGCSVSAIRGGRSVDTSMGFTPLEGLVMGTRSGDLDPALVSYLARKENVQATEVEAWLNERSGLLGVSGLSNDMRVLGERAQEDVRARLAVELFCYRARKYIGAYLAALGGADAVVFGGGIGENAPWVRAKICDGLNWCGLTLDPDRNAATVGTENRITYDDARLHAYVIPTDEEILIAEETVNCIREQRSDGGGKHGSNQTKL